MSCHVMCRSFIVGVDPNLSVGLSYVGEPPVSHNAFKNQPQLLSSLMAKEKHDIPTPMPIVTDLNKPNQFIGLDQNALRLLASFRSRAHAPELDVFDEVQQKESKISGCLLSAWHYALLIFSKIHFLGKKRSILSRTQSTTGETTVSKSESEAMKKGRLLTHAHTMSDLFVSASLSETVEQKKQDTATLRQRLRRNAVSGPAGVKPDDLHVSETKHKCELERASSNKARLEKKVEKLSLRVEEVEEELVTSYSKEARLQSELDVLIEDHAFLRKQNNALKVAISDSYRVCYEKTTEEIQKLGLDKLQFQKENMRSQTTQVACVPCDIAFHDPRTGPHTHKSPKPRKTTFNDRGVVCIVIII